jgi:hypothetical protein
LFACQGKGASASAASDGPETGGFFRRGKVIKGKMEGMAVILRLVFLVFHTSGFGPRSAFVGTWSSRKRLQVRHQTLMLVQQQGGDDNTEQSDSFNKLYSMLVKLQNGQDGVRNDVVKLQVGQDGVRNDTSELRNDVVKILDTQKNLVGYNRNRDKELELSLSNAFCDYLARQKWNVSPINVSEIFSSSGDVIAEWDFVFFATHPQHESTLFLGEVKQLAKSFHVSKLCSKASLMSSTVLPQFLSHGVQTSDLKDYKSCAGKFLKHLRRYPEYKVIGVLSFSGCEVGLMATMEKANISFLCPAKDQYAVTLRGLTDKPSLPPPPPPSTSQPNHHSPLHH